MAIREVLVDDWADIEGETAHVTLTLITHEEPEVFIVDYNVETENRSLCAGFLTFGQADFFTEAIHAAGLYGLCVSAKIVSSNAKAIYGAREASKRERPDLNGNERTMDIIERLKKKAGDLRGDAFKSLLDCIPLPKF